MTRTTTAETFVALAGCLPVVDIRAPVEFAAGHIPGAINLPLFKDEERAAIGTLYRESGHDEAVALGYRFVRPKLHKLVAEMGRLAPDGNLLMHCWRGGMRSESLAGLLETFGFSPLVLEGGYKAYRRFAQQGFTAAKKVVILSGLTGSGKTRLLQAIESEGGQMVDLEELAHHRGSAFGGVGQPAPPTTEQFENELFERWRKLDGRRPVWIESENQVIGGTVVPEEIWRQMAAAPAVFVEVNREKRLDFLLEEYGLFPAIDLATALRKIGKRLGGERLECAINALNAGDRRTMGAIALEYYDKAYHRSNEKIPRSHQTSCVLPIAGDASCVMKLDQLADSLLREHAGGDVIPS